MTAPFDCQLFFFIVSKTLSESQKKKKNLSDLILFVIRISNQILLCSMVGLCLRSIGNVDFSAALPQDTKGPWGHHSNVTSMASVGDALPHPPNFVIFLIHTGQMSLSGVASCSTPRKGEPWSTLADGSW